MSWTKRSSSQNLNSKPTTIKAYHLRPPRSNSEPNVSNSWNLIPQLSAKLHPDSSDFIDRLLWFTLAAVIVVLAFAFVTWRSSKILTGSEQLEALKYHIYSQVHSSTLQDCNTAKPVSIEDLSLRFSKYEQFNAALSFFLNSSYEDIEIVNGTLVPKDPMAPTSCKIGKLIRGMFTRRNLIVLTVMAAAFSLLYLIHVFIHKFAYSSRLHATLILRNMLNKSKKGVNCFSPNDFYPNNELFKPDTQDWNEVVKEVESSPYVHVVTEKNGGKVWKIES